MPPTITSATRPYAKFGANPSTGSYISQQNYIGLCPFSVTRSPRLTGQTDDGLSHLMARFIRQRRPNLKFLKRPPYLGLTLVSVFKAA